MFENHVLHPGDQEKDPETWPLLELENASVVRYRRGQPDELVDLFDVGEAGPFRVKGELVVVPRKHKKIGMSCVDAAKLAAAVRVVMAELC